MGPAPEGGDEEPSTTSESKGTVLPDDGAGRRRGAPMSFRELSMIDAASALCGSFAFRSCTHVTELASRERTPTLRVDDPPPGEEAQIDFGHVGYLPVDGVRKKLWALVVTLTVSRYMFVWTLLQQTTVALCEGLDAAWHFFDGVPKRLVPDNMSAAIVHASATDPTLQRGFLEYVQARGLYVDPARVRHPQDKPRVENQIAYVRERCFNGETFESLQASRHHAERWSREVAGGRVHGTTRLVPRDAYEQHEKPHMRPAPVAPFDVPTWSQHKVHPDHHVQIARALYSAPTRYIG